MNKTINEVLQIVDAIKPNTYDISAKLQWINEVDGSIWTELFKYKKTAIIEITEDISAYPLPEGANFNRITNAYLDGIEIPKLSNAQYKTTGISRGDTGNIILYPVPTGKRRTGYIICRILYSTFHIRHGHNRSIGRKPIRQDVYSLFIGNG